MNHLVPVVTVLKVQCLCPVDCIVEKTRLISVKCKAVAAVSIHVVRLHSILKTAGLSDDRNSTIVHGDELCQSAGLELRRHEQCVASGINTMASRLIVLDARGKLPLVFILVVPEGILILGIAGAEYHDLGERIHDLRDAGIYQIETFLVRQSGDESDNKLVLVLLKAELLLQITSSLLYGAAMSLSFEGSQIS